MTPPPQSRARPELPSTTHRSMVTDEVLRELCERFKTNGYVVVEDYLDDYVVRACLNEFETVLRARVGNEGDEDARFGRLEALGCVAQVNAPREADAYDANVNHRARGRSSVCDAIVSETLTRKGAIGSIAIALLGHDDTRLFNDQYVAKPPARADSALRASCFEWHRDSQWCDDGEDGSNVPYLSCWVALDDVSEENGTLRMLPYPPAASEATHRERASAYPPMSDLPSPMSGDACEDCGRLLTIRAGSVVFFSDVVFHCSGPNLSESIRRAWMPQFSAGPIVRADGSPVSLVARIE